MKKLVIILFISILIASCKTNSTSQENTNKQIRYFFENMAEFKCADSVQNRVKMSFLFNGINPDVPAFEFKVPDTMEYSGFYNSYMGRIVNAYYTSRNIDSLRVTDSLFISSGCDCDKVRNKIIEYYSNNKIFSGIFETSLKAFNGKMNEKDKVEISIDSLMQNSTFCFDLFYSRDGRFGYHFLCGTNPVDYQYDNKIKFLIPGFCQEALKNKEMLDVYEQATNRIIEKIKGEEPELSQYTDLKKFEKERNRMLMEEGTLKRSLLDYYEKRKDIEPFRITD